MDSERPAELPPEKPAHRHVSLRREETGRYTITNARGGTLSVGAKDDDFTAVELLLSAIAACSSIDVDYVTGRRAQPEAFDVDVDAEKVADERGNHLEDIVITASNGYHVLHFVVTPRNARLVLYVRLDRTVGNLAITQHSLRAIGRSLVSA